MTSVRAFKFNAPSRRYPPPASPRRPAAHHLIVNPPVRLLQPIGQARAWLPVQQLLNQRVIRVAPIHSLGRREVVAALELQAGDLLDDVDELIDRDQFAGA